MIFNILLCIGFIYSVAGAFCASLFFFRNKASHKIDEKIFLWFAAGLVYLLWPLIVFDGEARDAVFSRRMGDLVEGGER